MPDLREPRTGSAPNNSRSLPALPQRAACGRHPLLRPRRSGSPAGHGFPIIGNRGFIVFNNALQLCEADVIRVLELALRFLPMLGNLTAVVRSLYFSNLWKWGPRALPGPPIKWGPVRYAPLVIHCSSNNLKQFQPLLFPDIYRETETP